jgi:hypothetical protein
MVKREVFGFEGKGRRLGFLERGQSKSFFRERAEPKSYLKYSFLFLSFVNLSKQTQCLCG